MRGGPREGRRSIILCPAHKEAFAKVVVGRSQVSLSAAKLQRQGRPFPIRKTGQKCILCYPDQGGPAALSRAAQG